MNLELKEICSMLCPWPYFGININFLSSNKDICGTSLDTEVKFLALGGEYDHEASTYEPEWVLDSEERFFDTVFRQDIKQKSSLCKLPLFSEDKMLMPCIDYGLKLDRFLEEDFEKVPLIFSGFTNNHDTKPEIIEFFVDNDINLNIQHPISEKYFIHYAAINFPLDIFKYLLAECNDLDKNVVCKDNKTALDYVQEYDFEDKAKALLEIEDDLDDSEEKVEEQIDHENELYAEALPK